MPERPVYNRAASISYAHRHAFLPNGRYYNFEKMGGDCTNFISQCLFAGFPQMNYAQNGWYYNSLSSRAPAWAGVEFLYAFLVSGCDRPGPCARETHVNDTLPGDIIQLNFNGARFSHSLLVVDKSGREILTATRTDDSDYRPLTSYTYHKARGLHIL